MSSPHPQPPKSTAYETVDNPVTKTAPEQSRAVDHEQHKQHHLGDQHVPRTQSALDAAKPPPQARGVRGAGAGEEARGKTEEDVGRHRELDGEQIAPYAEGKVADAVERKPRRGSGGEAPDFSSDLDRKRAEQAPLREKIEGQRAHNVDVGGVLGQRGGPASTVD